MSLSRREFLKASGVVTASAAAALALAGCSNNADDEPKGSTPVNNAGGTSPATEDTYGKIDFNEEPYNIVVNFPVYGDIQSDLKQVEAAANEILKPMINATITLEVFSLATLANFFTLKAAGQEQMDLMLLCPGTSYMPAFANSNMIRPIDDEYAEFGQETIEKMGSLGDVGKFLGKQYCIVPGPRMKKKINCINMAYDVLERNNLSIDDVHSWDDVEKIFEVVHKNEPDLICFGPEASGATANALMRHTDRAIYNNYVAIAPDASGKLVASCLYEDSEYMDACKRAKRWYDNGWLSKDVLTSQLTGRDLQNAGAGFSYIMSCTPAMGQMEPVHGVATRMDGDEEFVFTSDLQTFLWAIAQSSKRPDKCVQFLNACMVSKELVNLLKWGIEGIHYDVIGDNVISKDRTEGYSNSFDIFGDGRLQMQRDSALESFRPGATAEEYFAAMDEWDASIGSSASLGFVFDPSNVKTEIASCDNVHAQYNAAIGNGTVDPEVELPKYISALYDAGLQKIIDEAQLQVDEWAALNA